MRLPYPAPCLLAGLGLFALAGQTVQAQCGPVIATFPYSEGFEAAAAWTSGGTGNDWAWGTPAHPLINTAGGGTRSWCVGGLSGTFYNSNERSWLESPCFDFSALAAPRISFKIFWEVERQYDGMTFQYSTDGGLTYSNVGAFGEAADCNTVNWFNSGNITNLGSSINPKHGWSGRQGTTDGFCLGGSGSQGWVTAGHCLAWLAHAPSVRFRFYFGAGSTCNNYDGIAIDDISISEASPVTASFSGDCTGSVVEFINSSTACPSVFAWDFGDPGSQQNTSTAANPAHTYAAPGTYTVSLTATDACGATGTTVQQISVLGVAITAVQPSCGQNNGSVEAVVSGANGPVSYYWSPGGATTQAVADLGPGTYTVTVSATNSCSATATATLAAAGNSLSLSLAHTDASCNGTDDGTATATVSGGTAPVGLVWAPAGSSAAAITGLGAGLYSCTALDAQGCSATATVSIAEPAPLELTAGPDATLCTGGSTTLAAEASGGTAPYAFTWLPEGPVVAPLASTTYSVSATDANGCTSPTQDVSVVVASAMAVGITVSDSTGCAPLCTQFTALPAGAAGYQWTFGDGGTAHAPDPSHCYTAGGSFAVALTVTDTNGCTGTLALPGLVQADAAPAVSFVASPPVTTIAEPLVHFTNYTTNADQYLWTFGDTGRSRSTDVSPDFAYGAVDCYTVTLTATNAQGCSDSARAQVCVEDRYTLYVPNAFTPDGDGFNDVFRPMTSVQVPVDPQLSIYDRWGEVLFTTTDLSRGWDGGGAPSGVYVWTLRMTDAVGEGHEHTGHVLLLR